MNKLLIVVDMQNDFVTGSLKNPAAEKIIPNIVRKLRADDYAYLAFTRDTHEEDYLETQEGKNLPVKHCIKNTEGWEIVPELQEFTDHALIIDKPTFGFKDWDKEISTYFDDTFPDDFPDEIELVGTCTDICVVSNALILKSLYPEMKITVDSSCCAGLTEEAHNAALLTMKNCQINVK